MSTHAFPVPDVAAAARVVSAVDASALPRGSHLYAAGTLTFTFDPDLSAANATTLGLIVRAGRSLLTQAERDALEGDIDGLRTYHGLASPTAAQTAQATKAIIRVLRALLRD
jgi:hypothetical protein